MTGTATRLLALLSLLQSRRDWPGQALADRLDVTTRTVRRDVDRLRELGYTVAATSGPDGGYRLAAGSELPPMLFDDEQAVAVAVALRHVASSGVDVEESAARALATVRQVMPSRLRHRVDGIRFTGSPPRERVDPAALEAVSAATWERRTLRFDYAGRAEPVRVEPHAVVARGGRWYLLAWHPDAAGWRTYRLDRMTPRHPAGARFVPRAVPTGDAVTFLAARARGGDPASDPASAGRWPCTGEVLLELPAAAVAPWLGDGVLVPVSATACRVTAGSWSWAGLLAWVLRFDAPFTVLGPDAFAEATAALARRVRAAAGGA
ncbi:YafY family protein [Cellulomonas sp. C5510]|uniref:helix-turn-helix transcriptional regulator n=1 Tax=Cellulomonas sp. C5510 TaxID=2871170 RepID=UPI001C97B525|nr:WYL domain-containing protein [Cellulomonas sp. C5510]QZN85389.1 WYL domain-containing protein [Cellulomonas sp. C5510]